MKLSLSHLLKSKKFPRVREDASYAKELEALQLRMLRVQQGVWHRRARVIVAFEGFDAAGKGGAIRRLSGKLDPRGIDVHPVGAPSDDERERHWLYRFWTRLPKAGVIGIFDRTWYGRVLVERVEGFAAKKDWKRGFDEINSFESTLANDGIEIVKIFLGISKQEQYKRFEDRLNDPYKNWKLTPDDVRGRKHWDRYVEAVDEMFARTNTKIAPWHLVPADDKDWARQRVLEIVTERLKAHEAWIHDKAAHREKQSLAKALQSLKK